MVDVVGGLALLAGDGDDVGEVIYGKYRRKIGQLGGCGAPGAGPAFAQAGAFLRDLSAPDAVARGERPECCGE